MSGSVLLRFLDTPIARKAFNVVQHFKRKDELDAEEQFALLRLHSWLARSEGGNGEMVWLDDEQRAYLRSFTYKHVPAAGPQKPVLQSPPSRPCGAVTPRRLTLQEMLDRMEDWERFDVFVLEKLTGGEPLHAVCMELLRRRGVLEALPIPEDRLSSFLRAAERAYCPNPYHNSTHAADVTQALGAMLAMDAYGAALTPLEQLALLIAGAVHDLGHPGVQNAFLVRTEADCAKQCGGKSVNESMHVALAFELLRRPENDFICRLPPEDRAEFLRLVEAMVLCTDMAYHAAALDDFADTLAELGPDLVAWPGEARVKALQMLLHTADISNPARPLHHCMVWGRKIHDEMYKQGDLERALGLEVTAVCDRASAPVACGQLKFINIFLTPCLKLVEGLAPNFVAAAMPHIEGAAAYWRSQIGEGGEEATACAPACATFPGSAALGSHEIPDPKPAKGA
ncbi:hypothetical protein ACKKBF_B10690 [Auxenochlorella protothecoides x Auxenochlorella symbiontica]